MTQVPTWKDYSNWCDITGRDPYALDGGNFTEEFANDERIKELWEEIEVPGPTVKLFFHYWRGLPSDDEITQAIQHWQKFFDS